MLGDIFISIPQMQKQAKDYGTGEKRELAFLVLHGLLHLLGYDHDTNEKEEVMFNLQKEILNEKKFSIKRVDKSFKYAFAGYKSAFQSEQNMKIHSIIAILVTICGLF